MNDITPETDPTIFLCLGIGIVVIVCLWHFRDWLIDNVKKPVDKEQKAGELGIFNERDIYE